MKAKLSLLAIFLYFSSHAQLFDGVETILIARDDAQTLIQGYTSPLMESAIYGLNTGWASTAKTHKSLGFDITLNAGVSMVGAEGLSFRPVGLDYVTVPGGELPTVFGEDVSTALDVVIPASGATPELKATLDFPGGAGNDLPVSGLPVPMAQLGVGALLNTDVLIRYVPATELEGVEFDLLGFGIKHDLTKYLGPIEKMPFHLSILLAQTKISAQYEVVSDVPEIDVTNGMVDFGVTAQTAQLLGSLDFPIISLFAAVGISKGSADLDLKGNYDLTYEQVVGNQSLPFTTSVSNPISLSYAANSTLATAGLRINLPLLKIYGQYSLQKYNTAAVGIALSIR